MATSDLITKIDAKISAILDGDLTDSMDYKIHGKTVTKSKYLEWLTSLRKELLAHPDTEIDFVEFDQFDVDEFGVRT